MSGLPFEDTTDFDDAERGPIGSLQPCVVRPESPLEVTEPLGAQSRTRMGLSERSPAVRALTALRRLAARRVTRYVAISSEIRAGLERRQGSNAWIAFTLREGKNREVRKVLEHLGLPVTRLIRLSFGPFQLGNLARGEVAEVPKKVLAEQLGTPGSARADRRR